MRGRDHVTKQKRRHSHRFLFPHEQLQAERSFSFHSVNAEAQTYFAGRFHAVPRERMTQPSTRGGYSWSLAATSEASCQPMRSQAFNHAYASHKEDVDTETSHLDDFRSDRISNRSLIGLRQSFFCYVKQALRNLLGSRRTLVW